MIRSLLPNPVSLSDCTRYPKPVKSIEEKIILLQEAKREMADAIMNGEGTSLASLSKEELLELVQ